MASIGLPRRTGRMAETARRLEPDGQANRNPEGQHMAEMTPEQEVALEVAWSTVHLAQRAISRIRHTNVYRASPETMRQLSQLQAEWEKVYDEALVSLGNKIFAR